MRLSAGGIPAILPGYTAKVHFGPQFEMLLARRIVIEQSPATEWPSCNSCECGVDARKVQSVGDRLIAPCLLDSARDTDLEKDDLRTFEIDISAVVGEIATRLGFDSEPGLVCDGVWLLGIASTRRAIFMIPSSSAIRLSGLITMLRHAAQGSPITIVSAEMSPAERQRFSDAGAHCIDILKAVGGGAESFLTLDLDAMEPPSDREPRLVLSRAQQIVRWDGQELRLSPRSFKLLWLLAEAAVRGTSLVSRAEIEKCLWGKLVVAKSAAADSIRDLRKQLRWAGLDPVDVVQVRQGRGYVLVLSPEELRLIP